MRKSAVLKVAIKIYFQRTSIYYSIVKFSPKIAKSNTLTLSAQLQACPVISGRRHEERPSTSDSSAAEFLHCTKFTPCLCPSSESLP